MNTGAREHLGGHSDLAPSLVLDSLALAVFGCHLYERLLERFDVNLVGVPCASKTAIEIPALLDEMRTLQRIGSRDLCVDLLPARHKRVSAHLAAASRAVLFQRDKIAAHGIALAAALCESILVGISESALVLSLSFAWRHITSVAAKATKCNLGSQALCSTNTRDLLRTINRGI